MLFVNNNNKSRSQRHEAHHLIKFGLFVWSAAVQSCVGYYLENNIFILIISEIVSKLPSQYGVKF